MKESVGKQLNSKKSKKILKIALGLFLEKGFENVTVRDIVKKSNSSMGNLYFHFHNKLEILQFISERFLDLLQEKTKANLDLPYEPHVQFAIDLRLGLRTTLEDEQLYKLFSLARNLPGLREHSIENKMVRLKLFFKDRYPAKEIRPMAIALQGISDAFYKVRGEENVVFSAAAISNLILRYNLQLLGFTQKQITQAIRITDDYFKKNDPSISFEQVIDTMV